jgi:opacity protein-like surface antigen
MNKLLPIILLFTAQTIYASSPPAEKATGIFLAVGVGPRFPISYFANSSDLGYGFNIEVSYTDNEYIPFFAFAKVGFEQFPGSQDFYQATDYSNFSTNTLPVHVGIRFFFPPLLESIALLIPMVEVAGAFTYYQKLHQFKLNSGRSNFIEESSKFGLSVGAGVSMFMLEMVAAYNYFQSNQFISFDLKVRLPLYISI